MQNTDPYQTPGTDNLTVPNDEIGPIEPITRSAGWLRFIGGITIAGCALSFLSILVSILTTVHMMPMGALPMVIFLAILIIPFWIGILVFQAGSKLKQTNDSKSLYEGANKLRLSIKIVGVIALIYFVLMIVGIIAAIAIPAMH